MIIEDPLEMGVQVRSVIETNPLAQLLTYQKDELQRSKSNFESIKADTLDLRRRLQNSIIEENVYLQRFKKNEIKVKHLEKVVEQNSSEFKCDFLNREEMSKFFEGIGLRFVSLSIQDRGSYAYLTYIRPSKMISTLPVQPMIISLYYELKNNALRFRKPIVRYSFTSETYMHPHISNESVCMGNYFDVFENEAFSVQLDGYQDQVLLLESLLSTFNPDSPYARIDQIIKGISSGVRFNQVDVCIDQGSDCYTLINPKLITGGSRYFYVHDLITEEPYRDYYAMLGNMPIRDTVQDIIDSLPNEYRDGDSENENFEHFDSIRSSLNKMFGVQLSPVEDYAYYEEDDDYYNLSEDNFGDMVELWIKELTPLLLSDDFFEFNNLPDLTEIFSRE